MKRIITLLFISCMNAAIAQVCIPNTNSMQFDGSSTYVSLPSSSALDITDSVSIEAWINSDVWAATSAQNTIVCKHGWSAGEGGYVLRAGGTGELSFNLGADSAGVSLGWKEVISSLAALQLYTWTHVAGTFDGTTERIYINGVLAGTNSFGYNASISSSTSYSMKIGRLSDSVQPETRYWTGKIDEVRVWHRVLSASDIVANMNKHIDPSTAVDLVGYWRFNEGSGSSAADLGTGNNTGTVNSGTWSTNVPFTNGPTMPLVTFLSGSLLSSSTTGNQWNYYSVPLPGETNQTFTPSQNGTYSVTVTDSNGCTVTSAPFNLTALAVADIHGLREIKIQNPSDGILHFISSDQQLSQSSLILYDVNGKDILSREKGSLKSELDLRSLPAGIYFLHLQNGNDEIKSKVVLF